MLLYSVREHTYASCVCQRVPNIPFCRKRYQQHQQLLLVCILLDIIVSFNSMSFSRILLQTSQFAIPKHIFLQTNDLPFRIDNLLANSLTSMIIEILFSVKPKL